MKRRKVIGYACLVASVCLAAALFWYSHEETPVKDRTVADSPKISSETEYLMNVANSSVRPFVLADLWVLNNDGGRDLNKLLAYFNARSGGLHFERARYAKKNKVKMEDEILFGVYMRINAEGIFDSIAVPFTESKNTGLANSIAEHIKENFRYRRAGGNTELILPVRYYRNK